MKKSKEKKSSWLGFLIFAIMLVAVLAFIYTNVIKDFA